MAFTFDTRVSVMDVIAIAGAAFVGYEAMFALRSDVELAAADRASIKQDVKRLELDVDDQSKEIIRQFEALNDQVKETREESKEGRERIEDKLDQLILQKLTAAEKKNGEQ